MDAKVLPICDPAHSSRLKVSASVLHTEERLRALHDRCWSVCWHHSGKLLASCGEDRTVKVWHCAEAEDGEHELEMVCPIRGDQTRSIRSVAFSPCGRFLASASFDASIVLYERQQEGNVVEFEELHRLEGHENEVKCVAFSRSGEHLATCSRDKSVWVWQVDDDGDYEVASILQHHTADVKFVVWHPREDLLLSGGYDGSIRFYTFDGEDWITEQAIKDAHEETVWAAAFEPLQGEWLATVGSDRTIRIWKCGGEKEAKSAEDSAAEEEDAAGERRSRWQKVAEHPLLDTRWPLYTVAWSGPAGDLAPGGILAVGGGDCQVRLFSFDPELGILALLDSLQMDSEVNCVRWRPVPGQVEQQLLAVALDSGWVKLLKMMGTSIGTEERRSKSKGDNGDWKELLTNGTENPEK